MVLSTTTITVAQNKASENKIEAKIYAIVGTKSALLVVKNNTTDTLKMLSPYTSPNRIACTDEKGKPHSFCKLTDYGGTNYVKDMYTQILPPNTEKTWELPLIAFRGGKYFGRWIGTDYYLNNRLLKDNIESNELFFFIKDKPW